MPIEDFALTLAPDPFEQAVNKELGAIVLATEDVSMHAACGAFPTSTQHEVLAYLNRVLALLARACERMERAPWPSKD